MQAPTFPIQRRPCPQVEPPLQSNRSLPPTGQRVETPQLTKSPPRSLLEKMAENEVLRPALVAVGCELTELVSMHTALRKCLLFQGRCAVSPRQCRCSAAPQASALFSSSIRDHGVCRRSARRFKKIRFISAKVSASRCLANGLKCLFEPSMRGKGRRTREQPTVSDLIQPADGQEARPPSNPHFNPSQELFSDSDEDGDFTP